MEAQVARPLERYLFTYDEVKRKKTTSTSSNGLCTMMVELQDNSQKLIINMNNCWANVVTSQRQLAIAYKSIEQSDENLRLNNNYYRAGTTTMSNLLDAQSCYQQARDKYVDAYIEYQESILKYQQAVGVHPEHKNK